MLHGSRGYLQSTCEIIDSDLQHQKTNNTVLCILLIPKTNQVKVLYDNSLSLRVQSEDKGWLLLHNLPWLPYCSYTSPIVNINKSPSPRLSLRTSCELHGYTCTSMDSLLLFIQNSLHCKQGGLYETSFLYVLQLFPPVIIQTRSSFLILYSGCYPLLPYKQEHNF